MRIYRFVNAEKAKHSVIVLCRALEISRSGYYAWAEGRPCNRVRQDAILAKRIMEVHQASRGTYGSPRVHAELAADGVRVSRKRIARLMRAHALCGRRRPRRVPRTTVVDHQASVAPNLVARNFAPEAPDRLWVSDITYVGTNEGWLYLAVVVDCYSRRVVGWSIADHLRTELPLAAFHMALARRRPKPGQLVHHSDRGCQYTSAAYREALDKQGVQASMSRTGNCWDNAVAESFFATLKAELADRHPWPTREAARRAVFEWIEVFYNRRRRHSTINYMSPVRFEERTAPDEVA